MTDKIPLRPGLQRRRPTHSAHHLALGSGAILRFIAPSLPVVSVSFAGQSYDAWPVHLQPPIYEQAFNGLRLSVSNRDHRFTSAFAADQIRFQPSRVFSALPRIRQPARDRRWQLFCPGKLASGSDS